MSDNTDCFQQIKVVAEEIPTEHQGIMFDKVFECYNSQEATRLLEYNLTKLWAERNRDGDEQLVHLLHARTV